MSALKSAPFRQQHESMRKCMADIKKHLNPFLLAQNADEVRRGLTQLFGELGKHLQQEAKDLYPALETTEDPAAQAVAARFGAEMKHQLPKLAEFNRRWTAAAIRSQATQFLKEADGVFGWLEQRIGAENAQLYPLLDKQDLASMASLNNPELKIARI
jgi:hemerythrin-like domain-containing protein